MHTTWELEDFTVNTMNRMLPLGEQSGTWGWASKVNEDWKGGRRVLTGRVQAEIGQLGVKLGGGGRGWGEGVGGGIQQGPRSRDGRGIHQ